MNLNEFKVVGRLRGPPREKFTQSGSRLANFDVLVLREWKAKDGTAQEEQFVLPFSAFGHAANSVMTHGKPDQLVLVCGRLRSHVYAPEGGTERTYVDLTAEAVFYLTTNGPAAEAQTQSQEGDWLG